MDIDEPLTLVGWAKLITICACVLAGVYGLFFATCAVIAWVQGL